MAEIKENVKASKPNPPAKHELISSSIANLTNAVDDLADFVNDLQGCSCPETEDNDNPASDFVSVITHCPDMVTEQAEAIREQTAKLRMFLIGDL